MEQREENVLSAKQTELYIKKSTRIPASYLRRILELSDTPQEVKPFFQVLENIYVDRKDIQKEKGMKTVGTFCVMVPEELVYAAGAVPVRLCSGSYTAYSIGDGFVPRDACPLVKAVSGSFHTHTSPVYDNCSLMVVPVTCDCKKKIAGMLGEIKPTVALQVPPAKAEDADITQYLQELYRLVPVLEKVTGKKITAQTLAESINAIGYAQYEMSRFLKYRKYEPALLHGAQVMAVMNAYAYMTASSWAGQMHRLNEEMEMRLRQKKFVGKAKQPRILVTGSPVVFPNLKIPLLIEEMGGECLWRMKPVSGNVPFQMLYPFLITVLTG